MSQDGAVEWLRAHRVGLGPLYVAVPVALVAIGLRLMEFTVSLLMLVTLAAAATFWALRARGWRRRFFGIATVVAVLWSLALRLVTTSDMAMWAAAAWLALLVAFAIPWWSDQVRRVQVTMEKTVREWPTRAERIRLGGTWMRGVTVTDIGWRAKLTWLPGAYTVEDVQARRGQIEGALGLRVGELRMPEDGRSTNSVNLVVVTDDPHAQAVPWNIPTTEVDGQHVLATASIADEFVIGVREDGTPKKLRLFVPDWGARQVLVGGIKGSGKSGLLNLIWAYLALCSASTRDVIQWGIDLKGGMEIGPWEKLFDWTATTKDNAWAMVRAIHAEMERREAYCKKRGWKKWKPDAEHPVLVVSVDESASMLGSATSKQLEMFADISRKARALGIVLILATQYPTLEAVGTSQIRQQIDQRFCFRMADSEGESYIVDARVDAHKIPGDRPGTCYHQDDEKLDRQPLRVLWVNDRDDDPQNVIAQLVSLLDGYTQTMNETAADLIVSLVPDYASRGVSSERDDETPSGETGGETTETTFSPDAENVSLADLVAARDATVDDETRRRDAAARDEMERAPRLTPEAAYQRLVATLRHADGALRMAELMEATTRKKSWVYERLRELEERGEVRRADDGKWRWTRSDDAA